MGWWFAIVLGARCADSLRSGLGNLKGPRRSLEEEAQPQLRPFENNTALETVGKL